MRLLRRQKPPEDQSPAIENQKTLALPAALASLESLSAPRILDFGAARGENVSFFSNLGAQIEILDLYARLNERHFDRRAIREVISTLDSDHGVFDLILAWDVLDYLNREQMQELFSCLEARRADGTRMVVFLSYAKEMPMHPRGFRIESPESLNFDPVGATRPCPRYQESAVLKVVPNLDVEASFLMRHGAREYVFRQVSDLMPRSVGRPKR